MKKCPKDVRKLTWHGIEQEIQRKSTKKDKTFILKGPWKKFTRKQGAFSVYAVDGNWVRCNLSVIFGHGGHEFVHEFIPHNEIWIATHHYSGSDFNSCGCDNLKKQNQPVSQSYFDSTTIHEITECVEMKKGKSYWESHHIALDKEREVGLLGNNPYREIDYGPTY